MVDRRAAAVHDGAGPFPRSAAAARTGGQRLLVLQQVTWRPARHRPAPDRHLRRPDPDLRTSRLGHRRALASSRPSRRPPPRPQPSPAGPGPPASGTLSKAARGPGRRAVTDECQCRTAGRSQETARAVGRSRDRTWPRCPGAAAAAGRQAPAAPRPQGGLPRLSGQAICAQ